MRILVVSDTHGNFTYIRDILAIHSKIVDMVIHLGDGEKDYEKFIKPLPIPTYFVRGNCDFGSNYPDQLLIEAEGKKIFFTHGYKYAVKSNYSVVKSAARAQGADIVLFGHTHTAVSNYENGLYTVNPGSLSPYESRPSYALIDIVPAGIMPNIVTI